MIGTLVYQLTRNLLIKDIKKDGYDAYFVDHTTGIYPQSAGGTPWSAMTMQSKGDVITDLHENMAGKQKRQGFESLPFIHDYASVLKLIYVRISNNVVACILKSFFGCSVILNSNYNISVLFCTSHKCVKIIHVDFLFIKYTECT